MFLRNLSYLAPISEIAVIHCLTKVPKGQMAFPMNHLSKMLPPDGPVALQKNLKNSKEMVSLTHYKSYDLTRIIFSHLSVFLLLNIFLESRTTIH